MLGGEELGLALGREAGVCLVYAYAAVCGLQALFGRYVAMGRAPEPAARPEEPSEAAPADGADAPKPPVPPAPTSNKKPFARRVMRSRFMG